jgi:hypothetical protein
MISGKEVPTAMLDIQKVVGVGDEKQDEDSEEEGKELGIAGNSFSAFLPSRENLANQLSEEARAKRIRQIKIWVGNHASKVVFISTLCSCSSHCHPCGWFPYSHLTPGMALASSPGPRICYVNDCLVSFWIQASADVLELVLVPVNRLLHPRKTPAYRH